MGWCNYNHFIELRALMNRVTASGVGIVSEGQLQDSWLPTSSGSRAGINLLNSKNLKSEKFSRPKFCYASQLSVRTKLFFVGVVFKLVQP
jgi:hypothetical protein